MRKQREIQMPAPYLRRLWLDGAMAMDRTAYPFDLPLFGPDFELAFEKPITILAGENGVGKSTLIEAIAALAGYDDAGGGKGHNPVDHSRAREANGGVLAASLKAEWKPKITNGWFFRAETFFTVARYLDAVGSPSADFLSHSHGEGFMRFFVERLSRQGIYFFDEPESALSPSRQVDFLKILKRINEAGNAQIIMATHSPLLMACPGAALMEMTRQSIRPTTLKQTPHFRLLQEFFYDPKSFIDIALTD
jgi:predicted ATPase